MFPPQPENPLRSPVSIPVLLAVSSRRRLFHCGRNNLRLLLGVPPVHQDGVDEGLDPSLGHDGSSGELEQFLVVQQRQLDTAGEDSLLTEIPAVGGG